jgi:hypothetical protein
MDGARKETTMGKPQKKPKQCRCIIAHAVTPEQRQAAIDRLAYSRKLGDAAGIMVALHQLGNCPSK